MAIARAEGRLVRVPLGDADLPVATGQVQLGERLGAIELV